MSAVAKLKAALGMDAAQYKAGMKNATGETDKFQNKIKTVGASMAAAFSVGAILNFARQATSLGSQLSDLASQSGINVETFQALEIAAINAGTGPEKLRTAMAKIGQTLGQARGGMKTYIDLLERAGLSQEQIARATPTETLEVLAKTVTNGQKGMADYEAVMQILGTRTGPLLIEVLNRIANEGIDNITKKAKESGQVIDAETIQRLDKMEDRLQRVSRTAKLKFGEAMVRVIDDVELLSTAGGAAVAFLTDRTVTFADAWQTVKDKVNEAKDAIDDAKAAEEDRPGRDIDPLREAIEKETRGGFTPEEAAERGKEAEKRQTKLIERQQKAAFDRLTTTEKIAQLEKEIATIQESRRKGFNRDRLDQVQSREKIFNREQEIARLKEQQAKEAEREAAQIERSREKAAEQAESMDTSRGGANVMIDQLARIGGMFGNGVGALNTANQQLKVQEDIRRVLNEEKDILTRILEGFDTPFSSETETVY